MCRRTAPVRMVLALLVLPFGLLAACGGPQDSDAVETQVAEQVAAALTAAASSPTPTETRTTSEILEEVAPTRTAEAERRATREAEHEAETATAAAWTPTVTLTPRPTPTSTPTETPVPTLETIVLSGSGDSVVDVDKPDMPAIVHIRGNAEGRYFGVRSLDASNESIELLVNTTDPYDGLRPLDFSVGEHTSRFEVSAVGAWTIEILPLASAPRLEVPGRYEGSGDSVVVLTGRTPDLAAIVGNASGRYFGVFGHGGPYRDLLVNTTDPYDGTVLFDSDTAVLEIQAIGQWTITVSD